jgi:tRNA A-37 threonylcarbamoyl transferase component Bud32
MLFHGTEIIAHDPRWPELARRLRFTHYRDIIAREDNPVSRTSITRVHFMNPDPQVWPGGIYLKKTIPDRWSRFFLRPAKSHLEARNYQLLERLEIPVPRVLATGQRRRFGALIDAFLITEGVANAVTLEQYASENAGEPPAKEFRAIFDQLVDMVRRMHRENVYHIDLQWRNVLVQRNPAGEGCEVKLFLIDSPRGGKRRLPLRQWNGRMHDLAGLEKLARLYLSQKERLHWFKRYLGGGKLTRRDRRMIQSIERELEHRRQRSEG